MKILFLSDTHGLHRKLENLPSADIIVHAGDMSMAGTIDEVMDFIEWFGELDYRYKIFIAGNHDDCLDGATVEGLPDNCHYLSNSGVVIEGVKFWGIPFFMSDDIEERCPEQMRQIPVDTDVLITHRPPLGILDTAGGYDYGCLDMLEAVLRIRPRYHLFGHIHDAYGIKEAEHTIFANGALLDERYRLVNQPVEIEI